MQNQYETLSDIIKNVRMKADITIEKLAAETELSLLALTVEIVQDTQTLGGVQLNTFGTQRRRYSSRNPPLQQKM